MEVKVKYIDRYNVLSDYYTQDENGNGCMASELDDDYKALVYDEPKQNPDNGLYHTCFYKIIDDDTIMESWEIPDFPIDELRRIKADKIIQYDESSAVNGFVINLKQGDNILETIEDVWIVRDDRNALDLRFKAEIAAGTPQTNLWYRGMAIIMPPQQASQILLEIEVYAAQCYDKTQEHLLAIEQMTNKDDIIPYDHTAGYPQKLTFTIEV